MNTTTEDNKAQDTKDIASSPDESSINKIPTWLGIIAVVGFGMSLFCKVFSPKARIRRYNKRPRIKKPRKARRMLRRKKMNSENININPEKVKENLLSIKKQIDKWVDTPKN